jgi:hypothetical protein
VGIQEFGIPRGRKRCRWAGGVLRGCSKRRRGWDRAWRDVEGSRASIEGFRMIATGASGRVGLSGM